MNRTLFNKLDEIFTFSGPPKDQSEAPVVVCLDFEAWERDQNMITEIGITTFDTATIPARDGEDFEAWLEAVKAEHIIIREHAQYVNYRYVKGCPDKFQFGTSTTLSLTDAQDHLLDALHAGGRPVVLAAHGLAADMRYLNRLMLGSDVLRGHRFFLEVDTQRLCMITRQPKLSRVLDELRIDHSYLHNAGNDAMYTMNALLALVHAYKFEQPKLNTVLQRINY